MCEVNIEQFFLTPEDIMEGEAEAKDYENLNDEDAVDSIILQEIEAIRQWAGVEAIDVYWTKYGPTEARGNAHTGFYITLNRAAIVQLLEEIGKEAFTAALFFALAHECAHVLQFQTYGKEWMGSTPEIHQEAAADVLAGVWAGFNFVFQHHDVEHVKQAANLIGRKDGQRQLARQAERGMPIIPQVRTHPTAFQRTRLVEKGYAEAAGLLLLEHQMREMGQSDGYVSAAVALTEQDMKDLHDVAVRQLGFWPPEDPGNAD